MASGTNPVLYLDAKLVPDLEQRLNKEIAKIGKKLNPIKLDVQIDKKKIDSIIKDINNAITKLQKAGNRVNGGGGGGLSFIGDGQLKAYELQIKRAYDGAKNVNHITDSMSTSLNKALNTLAKIETLAHEINNGDSSKETAQQYKDQVKWLNVYITQLKDATSEQLKYESAQAKALAAQQREQEKAIATQEKHALAIRKYKDELDRLKETSEGRELTDEASKYLSGLENRLEWMSKHLNEITDDDLKKLALGFKNANDAVKDSPIIPKLQETSQVLDSTDEVLSSINKKLKEMATIAAVFGVIKKVFSDSFKVIKEIDTAMVALRKVTDETDASYKRYIGTATQLSKQLGTSIQDTISMTAQWAQLGYSMDKATELAKSSIIYANVGDLSSTEDAVQGIVTAMKAFEEEGLSSMDIVDRYNELSNKFAVTAEGLGQAMMNSASSLSVANNTFSQSLAMITGITQVTGDASSAGNALKVLSMRIRGAKIELDAMGEETEGMVTSIPKLRDEILKVTNVDIVNTNGALKSTYDILGEISKVWDDLDDITQAALLEKLAGKNRANEMATLLKNWDSVIKAEEVAENSAGSALKEQQAYTDTIDYKLNQIKTTWNDLQSSLLNSDGIKFALDSFTKILSLVTDIVKNVGGMGGILGAGAGAVIGKNGGLTSSIRNIKSFGSAFFNTGNISREDAKILAEYNRLTDQLIAGGTKFNGITKEQQTLLNGLSSTVRKNAEEFNGAKINVGEMGKAAEAASIKMQLLNAAMGALIGIGISLLIKGIQAIAANAPTIENLTKKIEQSEEAVAGYTSEIEANSKAIDENNKLKMEAIARGEKNSDTVKNLNEENKRLEEQNKILANKIALERIQERNNAKKVAEQLNDKYGNTSYTDRMNAQGAAEGADVLTGYQIDSVNTKLERYNELLAEGKDLTDNEFADLSTELNDIADIFLNQIAPFFSEEQLNSVPVLKEAYDIYKQIWAVIGERNIAEAETADNIADVNDELYRESKYVKAMVKDADKGADLRKALADEDSLEILLENEDAMKALAKAFPNLLDELEAYVDGAKDFADIQDDIQNALNSFDATNIVSAFDAAKTAIKNYGASSYEAEQAMQELINSSPALASVISRMEDPLNTVQIAAENDANAFLAMAIAEAQEQVQAARANYSKYSAELGALQDKLNTARGTIYEYIFANAVKNKVEQGDELRAAMTSAQADLATLQNMKINVAGAVKTANAKKKGSSGSKGSSSKKTSILDKDYEALQQTYESYVKQSETRQKRMEKDTDEYNAEIEKQYKYNVTLAEATYKELERLRKKGYDESNDDFKKLAEKYEGYLTDLYSLQKNLWEISNAKIEKDLKAQKKELEDNNDALDKQIDEIKKLQDAEKERWDARESQLEFEIDRNEAIIDLEEAYYDLIQEVKSEQLGLNSELKKSQEAYEYLDEETRKLLFNDDDYNTLSKQLNTVAEEATQMYDDYLEKLNNVTEETQYELEYITDEFERQYELKMKQYDIAKQELAVAKAQKELENTRRERNVAMLVNGQWTWVADPEAVKSAIDNVSEAQNGLTQLDDELTHLEKVQGIEATNSNLTLQKNQEEAASNAIIESLQNQIDSFQSQIDAFKEQIDVLNNQLEALKDLVFVFSDDSLSAGVRGSFADGGLVNYTGLAMVHGANSGEMVLNNSDIAKLYSFIHNSTDLYSDIFRSGVSSMGVSPYNGVMNAFGGASMGNSTNVYIDGVHLNAEDSANILEIFKRVIPMSR